MSGAAGEVEPCVVGLFVVRGRLCGWDPSTYRESEAMTHSCSWVYGPMMNKTGG